MVFDEHPDMIRTRGGLESIGPTGGNPLVRWDVLLQVLYNEN